jgi:hypothetical protein
MNMQLDWSNIANEVVAGVIVAGIVGLCILIIRRPEVGRLLDRLSNTRVSVVRCVARATARARTWLLRNWQLIAGSMLLLVAVLTAYALLDELWAVVVIVGLTSISAVLLRAWYRPAGYTGLVIHIATYGTKEKMNDVTGILESKVKDGRLELEVANDNLGGDPAYGEKKTLNVTYTYSGERHCVAADEWQTLALP